MKITVLSVAQGKLVTTSPTKSDPQDPGLSPDDLALLGLQPADRHASTSARDPTDGLHTASGVQVCVHP